MEKCGGTAAGKKRSHYAKFTSEQRAEIGHRAAEHGVVSTVLYYNSQISLNLHQGSQKEKKSMNVTELPERRRGRPLMLGEESDRQVQLSIRN